MTFSPLYWTLYISASVTCDVNLANNRQLAQISPRSLYNVSLSSRALHHLAQKHLYRKLRFTFARYRYNRNRLLLQKLLTDPTACSSVHEVYINWLGGANPRLETEEGSQMTQQLIDILPRLTSLRRFMYVSILLAPNVVSRPPLGR